MERSSFRKKLVRMSYLEGACFGIMAGSGESYLLVAAVRHGLSGLHLSLATQLPVLIGALGSLFIPFLFSTKNLRKGILASVGVQIIGLGLIVKASFSGYSQNLVLPALILYWLGGMSSGPLWLDWMAGWFPGSKIRSFISKRNAFVLMVTLASFLSSSFLFYQWDQNGVFKIIFMIAFTARVLSLILFLFHPNPLEKRSLESSSFQEKPASWKISPEITQLLMVGSLLIFLMHFAVGFSSPFFISYKLNDLHLSNQEYVWLTSIPFIARSFVLAIFSVGQVRFYPPLMLGVSVFGIASLPIMYSFISTSGGLIWPELAGGAFWATFELSLSLFVLSRVKLNPRLVLGIITAADGFGLLFGGMLGGKVLESGIGHIQQFQIGSALRLVAALAIWWSLRRVKFDRPTYAQSGEFLSSVLSLRPSLGSVRRLIPIPRFGGRNSQNSRAISTSR